MTLPGGRRGQLVLVAGLVLAVVFVGLALTVNSLIYTENLATEQREPSRPAHDRVIADRTVAGAISYANSHNTENHSYARLNNDLQNATANVSHALHRERTLAGASVSVDLVSVGNGTRIKQTNHERNFTAGDQQAGRKTWSVVEGVSATDVFWLNVSNTSAAEQTWGTTQAAMANSSFHITIDEPGVSGLWRVYVFRGAATGKVYVVTEPPSNDYHLNTDAHIDWADACASSQRWVRIDVEEALVDGFPCDELLFFEDLNEGYDVYYNRTAETLETGTTVNRSLGTYELFVSRTGVDHRPFYTDGAGRSPFVRSALFSADVSFEYATDAVSYRDRFESRPARAREPGNLPPSLGTFDVHDNVDAATTPPDNNYTVDWAVSDASGLTEVELVLSENATGTRLDTVNVSVSGTSASGTTELDDTTLDVEGTEYEIWLVATDAEGATETARVVDTNDGDDP